MTKAKEKKKTSGKLMMRCLHDCCDSMAVVTPGKGNRIRGAKFQDYTYVCECRAKGSFTEEHFKLMDKAGKFTLK